MTVESPNLAHKDTSSNIGGLRRGITRVKTINDYLTNHKETPEVNREIEHMIKGGIGGAYAVLRNEGSILIARHLLLEEGLPQMLSPRQEVYLAHIDEQYNISLNDRKGSI